MNRQPPRVDDDAIDLYIRTYTSLLRSSGHVPVRAFEEAHLYSGSSLHEGARDPRPDVAAFAYSAGRLPDCMPSIRRIVLGQAHEQFESAGLDVRSWPRVRARGRRRPLHFDGAETLAAFVTSVSDIDDLVPIVTAWQIEWNKMHHALAPTALGRALASGVHTAPVDSDPDALARALGLDRAGLDVLKGALADAWDDGVRRIAAGECDLTVQLLAGTYAHYQRAAQRWWGAIEPLYLRDERPRRRPVYFVSSNTHALPNLLGGWPLVHRDRLLEFVRATNPEGLAPRFERAIADGDEAEAANLSFYLLRAWMHAPDGDAAARKRELQDWDADSGFRSIEVPGKIDVDAQIVALADVVPERLDPRVRVDGLDALRRSEAVIVNIDYPLGMAAYHHLSRLAQGVGEIRGVYVMGKAASLNARVGDVLISSVVQDDHSRNTYLFRNVFLAGDVQPYMRYGSVLDNQKAVTVRGAYLQSRATLGGFYHQGYTALEMEAGPYLSAIHEIVSPTRHPNDELAHLSNVTPFDVGLLHYASDTPYSRRQSLLSKSLSYFGIESTYACAIAIVRRVLEAEIARLR